MSKPEVFIVAAKRTPIGAFQGALADVPAPRLGATAIAAALEASGLKAEDVQETFMGNVLTAGLGQAPARQAAKYAGIPDSVPATTVGKVCGSGLQSVVFAAKSILLGDASVVVAGGMESMTQAPYLLPKARGGYRMGHGQVQDSMILDGLWDPYNDQHMGNCGELCAKEFGFTREAQDEFSRQSYELALGAQESKAFDAELTSVTVKTRKGDVVVSEDEEPKRARLDKMPSLRPAFDREGTITAANASKINDGASALVLASGDVVKAQGLKPIAKLVGYAAHAQAPEWFTTAPVGAMKSLLDKTGLKASDIDLFEVNEAFAVVAMAAMKEIGFERDKLNVHGGAVALGHPIGCSGARILTTLIHALHGKDLQRGMASICIGGGEALAMVVERV
ncbi:MAG: thiolase family protein [Myxococcota bacterium]|nr:thiolase family protein [Myxococcota bacterium]